MKKDEHATNAIGTLFLTFGILAIINTINNKEYCGVLWFCYPGLIILGIGFLKRSRFLVESQLNILIFPLIIWTIDFIYYLFLGHSLFNIVDYFFQPFPFLSKIITSQHLFTIPLALYSMRFLDDKKQKSYILSFIYAIIIFLLARFLTPASLNINWVYKTSLDLAIPFYPIFWILGVFLMIFLTNLIIKKI